MSSDNDENCKIVYQYQVNGGYDPIILGGETGMLECISRYLGLINRLDKSLEDETEIISMEASFLIISQDENLRPDIRMLFHEFLKAIFIIDSVISSTGPPSITEQRI
jgi:hypothetical protein